MAASAHAQGAGGILSGRVLDDAGVPVAGARVVIAGLERPAVTRSDGTYAFVALARGTYAVQAVRLGYAPSTVDSLVIGAAPVVHDFTLRAASVALSTVVISPGSYAVLDRAPPSQQVLSREELLTRPRAVEDVFRALNRLPGFSGSDFSSQLRIRNSAVDEVLVTLDGLELIEPFHMKDFEGSLTILDQDVIGRIEVNTGGFGAQLGNRAAGVLQLSSVLSTGAPPPTALSISLANVRAQTGGTFSSGRGAWMVSARRGYLDVVFSLLDLDDVPDPRFYDVFAKVRRAVGTRHVAAVSALVANDRMSLSLDEGTTLGDSRYGNAYLWTTLETQWTDRWRSTMLASLTALDWKRDGSNAEFFGPVAYPHARHADERSLDAWSLKQDWTFDATPRLSLAFGGELRGESATYDYHRVGYDLARFNGAVIIRDSTVVNVDRDASGLRVSGYGAVRVRPVERLTIETGLRSDRHEWTGQTTTAPRVSAAVDVSPRTTVRTAWGIYPQAHALQDLAVIDGDSVFARAERSEQRIVSVEHRPSYAWTARIEAFDRHLRDPRPRWYGADGDLDNFPEGKPDRVRVAPDEARIRGVELLAAYDAGGRLRATAWYALGRGRATTAGVETPRPFDETHSGAMDIAWRSRSGWTWAAAWTFRSGWPSIPGSFRVDTLAPGQYTVERNTPVPEFTERLPAYQRLDVRMSRRFSLGRGALSVFAEVFNVLDTDNQSGWSYNLGQNNGQLRISRDRESFLGRLPTAGLRWEF